MTILLPFQKKGIKVIDKFNGRALIADEMGLGKTIQALRWGFKYPDVDPIIIVCPAYLKVHWERECRLHLGVRADILYHKTPPKNLKGLKRVRFIIINYEILGGWLEILRRMKPKLVILDEVHYIQNRDAKRTKNVKQLVKGIPHLLCLSGTPFTNRPAELWVTLNLLHPDKYRSYFTFGYKFANAEWTRWGVKFKGGKNLNVLHRRLKRQGMIRRLKKDVLKDLPPKRRVIVPFELSKKDMDEYQKILTEFTSWVRKNFGKGRANKAARAERVVKLGYLKRFVAERKLPQVIQWLDDMLEEVDGKIIVFGVHRTIIQQLHERYKNIAVRVDGSVTKHKRQMAFDHFTKGKKVRLLIGGIRSAGTGWNGSAARATATIELGWTPGEHDQADARPHRIGLKWPIDNYYLIALGTIEEDLCLLIQEKQKDQTAALDGEGKGNSLDLFDELTNKLLGRRRS